MSSATSELAHLFRALKAPAAARAFPALAERAREESWSYEKFLQALLATEVSVCDSHGGPTSKLFERVKHHPSAQPPKK
jgi:hypothetical protein